MMPLTISERIELQSNLDLLTMIHLQEVSLTFRRCLSWYPGHDGSLRDAWLVQDDEDDEAGAGHQPNDQEDVAEEGQQLGAPLLCCVALRLLLHSIL